MYPNATYPNALSGSGYLLSVKVSKCLYEKGLDTPFMVLEDIFITGLVASQCPGLTLKNSPRFQYMGMHVCLVKKKFDLLIHNVKSRKKMEMIHKTLTKKASCRYTDDGQKLKYFENVS